MKKCRACKEPFEPFNSMAKACSVPCALTLVADDRAKANRKEVRELKQAHRDTDKSWWIKKVQVEFNKFIRGRDKDLPCISCGEVRPDLKYDAGHYRSCGAAPELRFEELNCHRQCSYKCNQTMTGNIIEYRKGLIKKIGQENLDWLEGPHEPKKYTVADLKELFAHYGTLNKEK